MEIQATVQAITQGAIEAAKAAVKQMPEVTDPFEGNTRRGITGSVCPKTGGPLFKCPHSAGQVKITTLNSRCLKWRQTAFS